MVRFWEKKRKLKTCLPYMGIFVARTCSHKSLAGPPAPTPNSTTVSWISLSLSYAAIQAFCLINNLSVMYRTPALIWLSVKCVWRWLPALFLLSFSLCLQNQPWYSNPPSQLTGPCSWCIFSLCLFARRDEDGRAILKGLQLHLNGIIRHDAWLLPLPQCLDLSSSGATRL